MGCFWLLGLGVEEFVDCVLDLFVVEVEKLGDVEWC